jgi:hypothetical protein
MFKFHEGEKIKLKDAFRIPGISTDAEGVIWGLYDSVPPAYEVTFLDDGGKPFDMLVYEEEIMQIPGSDTMPNQGSSDFPV